MILLNQPQIKNYKIIYSLLIKKIKKMSHNHSDDISGKIFFKFYKAQKKLGEGSFGKIYTAINTKTKEEFALKLVIK
jgi:serine/threonine protein kinase